MGRGEERGGEGKGRYQDGDGDGDGVFLLFFPFLSFSFLFTSCGVFNTSSECDFKMTFFIPVLETTCNMTMYINQLS